MFEFEYCVSLDVVHPSADPKQISDTIKGFRITNETKVGTPTRTRDGNLMQPRRLARVTHWGANLHDEKRIYSGEIGLAEFLSQRLSDLQQYRDLFFELGQEGDVFLRIGWFSETSHSAACLDAAVVKKCADVGLGIELNYYAPPEDEE